MDDELRSRYRVNRGNYDSSVRRRPSAPVHHQRSRPNQPARSVQRPVIEPARPVVHVPRQSKRQKLQKAVLAVLVLTVLGGIVWWAYSRYADNNPFPANIQTNAQVLLFYPMTLPAGFQIDPSSMHFANGALIYDARKGDSRLVFTTQKTPPTFDYTAFYQQQLKDTRQFKTDLGEAAIGKLDERYLGSLVAGNSWLLLSTNSTSLSSEDMHQVIANLKKY